MTLTLTLTLIHTHTLTLMLTLIPILTLTLTLTLALDGNLQNSQELDGLSARILKKNMFLWPERRLWSLDPGIAPIELRRGRALLPQRLATGRRTTVGADSQG